MATPLPVVMAAFGLGAATALGTVVNVTLLLDGPAADHAGQLSARRIETIIERQAAVTPLAVPTPTASPSPSATGALRTADPADGTARPVARTGTPRPPDASEDADDAADPSRAPGPAAGDDSGPGSESSGTADPDRDPDRPAESDEPDEPDTPDEVETPEPDDLGDD